MNRPWKHPAFPVVVGLVLLWSALALANENFLTPQNLTNLALQMASMGALAVGVVLVLLLGEMDLSVGLVGGLCAAVMGVLTVQHGVPGPLALLVACTLGAGIGALHGAWHVVTGIPSFIITLGGLMAWQGALLAVLGTRGTLNLTDPFILALAGTFVAPESVLAAGALSLVGVVFVRWRGVRSQHAETGFRAWDLGLATLGLVAICALGARDRGVPLSLLILVGLAAVVQVFITRTRPGRHVLAVGGNAAAARRMGIRVGRIKVLVFALTSACAALSGVLGASRLLAVHPSAGTGDVLLNAIAAAVIGGTSLFGGRGSAWSAVLGALVISSVSNGMDLLALPSAVKFMVTGAVLLATVTAEAVARRGKAVQR
jgi:D-xylose transport system permease protein